MIQVLTSVLLSSCIVLEDRKLCPCTLVVRVAAAPPGCDASDSVAVSVKGESGFVWQTRLSSANLPCTVSVGVPKGEATVTAAIPAEASALDGEIVIPYGSECPYVWLDGEVVDTDRSRAVSKLTLHKNWCEIRIRMLFPATLDYQTYALAVTGNVSGFKPGSEPAQGLYRVACVPSGELCTVRVPRQLDNSLRLEVNVPSNGAMPLPGQTPDLSDTSVLRVFAIGEYIAESGYDWTLPDLEDVELTLDIASSCLILRRSLWESPLRFELVI